jgi:hypothetical protein
MLLSRDSPGLRRFERRPRDGLVFAVARSSKQLWQARIFCTGEAEKPASFGRGLSVSNICTKLDSRPIEEQVSEQCAALNGRRP